MKKRHFFAAVITVCLFASCNSDEEYQQRVSTSKLSQSDYITSDADIPYDATSALSKDFAKTRSSSLSTQEEDTIHMTDYGYTNMNVSGYKTKASYKSMHPVVLGVGLPGGIYIVEVKCVTKELYSYRANDLILPTAPIAENKDMGLTSSGYFNSDKGWTSSEVIENGDKKFIGTTYLIHFISTLGGAQLDKYYPCRPEELVWRYISRKL